jgi:hypothetical protein
VLVIIFASNLATEYIEKAMVYARKMYSGAKVVVRNSLVYTKEDYEPCDVIILSEGSERVIEVYKERIEDPEEPARTEVVFFEGTEGDMPFLAGFSGERVQPEPEPTLENMRAQLEEGVEALPIVGDEKEAEAPVVDPEMQRWVKADKKAKANKKKKGKRQPPKRKKVANGDNAD